jgi:hypothetical protein
MNIRSKRRYDGGTIAQGIAQGAQLYNSKFYLQTLQELEYYQRHTIDP